jgi:hypothetical protein
MGPASSEARGSRERGRGLRAGGAAIKGGLPHVPGQGSFGASETSRCAQAGLAT